MNRFREWIIREDADYLVINKPPNVASLHERQDSGVPSVLEAARAVYPDAQLCHRLDRETSGAMVIALNPEAYRNLALQFEQRTVTKIYHCVVEGQLPVKDFVVDLPINTDDAEHIRIDKKRGKPALTVFSALELFRHFTLMEARPKTGRMHQIRVHLASQNARIACDTRYGGREHLLSSIKRHVHGEDSPLIKRFALHAHTIRFKALDGTEVEATAPYPKDLEVFVKLLRKYDRGS